MTKTTTKPKPVEKLPHGHIKSAKGGGFIVETGHHDNGPGLGNYEPPVETPFEPGHGHMALAHLAKHMGIDHEVENEAAEEKAEGEAPPKKAK